MKAISFHDVDIIGDEAFRSGYNLGKLTIPEGVTKIVYR